MNKNDKKYKILTPNGWADFDGIKKIPSQPTINITLNNNKIINCTLDHKIYINLFECVEAKELKPLDWVFTNNGMEQIKSISDGETKDVYDILNVDYGNKFFTNDILVHNCEFIGKSNSLIDSMILRQKILEIDNNKITYKFVVDEDIRFYQDLKPWKKYLVAIDTSMGLSGDFAAIQVFEFPGFIQVAEWKSDKLNQNDQIEKMKVLTDWMYINIKEKGNKHPEIYWSLENNGSAEGFLCALKQIEDSQYGQPYIKRATLINEIGNKRKGFTTTKITKPKACSQLKILFETNRFHIFSRDYLTELSNFSNKSVMATSYSANGSGHDDLITASLTIILMYLQCKDKYDLDFEIMPDIPNELENTPYDDTLFLVSIS